MNLAGAGIGLVVMTAAAVAMWWQLSKLPTK
jgi:hypothetical protein